MRMSPPKRIGRTTKMWKRLAAVGPKGLPAENVRKITVKEGSVMGTAIGAASTVRPDVRTIEIASSVLSSTVA